ncbi:MAG: bifunctional UDP-N-acetylglucosamine diphosphorylase/glucosamine-1-phosphate N-acetyltransferase GlmU [Blastocatellia bacterium]|nr:bifunctional UDP-N-acetylglucosamine diphosphorylase/glucosamine-1-phosphate N-acetyltransferase GlmU [Blastocatellia bacterium]
MSSQTSILIMAAGLGTRMKSNRAKVLHELAGRTLIGHVCRAALALHPTDFYLVVGHQAEAVQAAVEADFDRLTNQVATAPRRHYVVQAEQRGTGHAVMMAASHFENRSGSLLVLSGDVPLVRPETLQTLLETHHQSGCAATVLTTEIWDPTGYGRILREANGYFARIVEHRDATAEQRTIKEINSGLYVFEMEHLFPALNRLTPANAQGEYYLTDVLGLLKEDGHQVGIMRHSPAEEVLGINSRVELAQAAERLRLAKLEALMRSGVTILDPKATYIDGDVQIGMDSVIYPNVTIEGASVIGERATIHPNAHLVNARLGNGVTVRDATLVVDSTLEDETTVGPFAHLRMESVLKTGAVVGNFVEMKKSTLGPGSKSMHLTYLGDATIGSKVNIGAGTITCNYDGKHKHPTVIQDGVKIGSDTMLVAPVTVGRNSVTAAGSVVIKDIPEDSLVAGVPAVVKKNLKQN